MKTRLIRLAGAAFLVALGAVAFVGFDAAFTPEAEALLRPAPPFGCPDLWAPVICDNGQVYSNFCYANLAGATGCVPFGLD